MGEELILGAFQTAYVYIYTYTHTHIHTRVRNEQTPTIVTLTGLIEEPLSVQLKKIIIICPFFHYKERLLQLKGSMDVKPTSWNHQ